jgi:phage tail sheath protein FI
VWGARTLSTEPAWTYVNVRRLVLTVARAVGVIGAPLVFEPQGEALWRRVRRDVSAFLTRLYGQGALRGASASDAFYVRCDAQTNAGAEQGQLVAEIGLAAARPNEFIVVHVVNEAGGVSVAGPNQSN